LGPALRERGLLFVGIDVIDGHLAEINVTPPTGIRAIVRLGGPDVAAKVWDVIESKRGVKTSRRRLPSRLCTSQNVAF
jgi:glutathione synthase